MKRQTYLQSEKFDAFETKNMQRHSLGDGTCTLLYGFGQRYKEAIER